MKSIALIITAFALSVFASANFSTTTPSKRVDILFVIDNSGSMGPHQNSFSDRVGQVLAPYANYSLNVGLITTDPGISQLFVGTPVNGTFNDVIEQLKKDISTIGTNGSASEQYMTQVLATFENNGLLFHRPNTELQVFIVTDEDEQTMTAKEFVTQAVKYKSFDKLFINVFAPKCKTFNGTDWDKSELFFLSTITGGIQGDLCLNSQQ
jgi:hypothetical protein